MKIQKGSKNRSNVLSNFIHFTLYYNLNEPLALNIVIYPLTEVPFIFLNFHTKISLKNYSVCSKYLLENCLTEVINP